MLYRKDMKYKIQYLSDHGFDDLTAIDDYEFKIIKESIDFILFYYSFEELFDMVRVNIYEFWKLYFETLEKHRLKIISKSNELIKPITFFNQSLANILTSFKSYNDHIERKISDVDSKYKDTLVFYRQKYSEYYDQEFNIRFFTRLRNYVQHFGFPISKINYHSDIVDEYVEHTISLVAFKSDLLKYKKWSKVKSEIEKLDEEIDLKKYMNAFLYSFSSLHEIMRKYYFDHYIFSFEKLTQIKEKCIEDNYMKYQKRPNKLEVIYITKKDDSSRNEKFWLPLSRISDIQNYFIKNKLPETIKKSYSTNK